MEKRNIRTDRGEANRHIKMVNKMIRFYNEEIAKLKEEAKQLAKNVKDKVIKVARNLEQLRKNFLCTVYAEKDNDKKIERYRKLVPKDMDVIKRAYDLIKSQKRLSEEKQAYVNVINNRKEKKKRKQLAEETLRKVNMELYQIDRELRDLPNFYKMYSMYEMEECISNEERYGDIILKLKKAADKIDMNKALAYLEYDLEKGKVESDDKVVVEEEQSKIRPEMNKQARAELTDAYGAETDTPESVAKLATKILNINNDNVADFCSGIGNFLMEAIGGDDSSKYYGVEINTQCKEISTIRLQLLSESVAIEQGTVFDMDASKKFDKIFCDYPWNVKMWNLGKEKMQEFEAIIPEIKKVAKADWLFILNVLQHLEDDGKAVVVTTNGTAWNGGISKTIREKFVKQGWIEAVISLPANLYTSTAIPTLLLVLSKGNKTVRMVDASTMATVGRRQNVLSDDALTKIVDMLTNDTDNAKSVTIEDIKNQDYAINPSRFLEVELEVKDGVPFEDLIVNVTRGAQVKASELDGMVSEDATEYQYLMLANIQDGLISDELPFLKSIDKKMERYCIKNNSLVISKNGTPVKIAVASVAEGRKILANGNLYVIELDETKANPYFVKAYLESENGTIALSRVTVGAVMPNIPVEGLKKVMIPCPELAEQNKVAEKYLAKMDEVRVLKYKLAKATAELKSIYEEG